MAYKDEAQAILSKMYIDLLVRSKKGGDIGTDALNSPVELHRREIGEAMSSPRDKAIAYYIVDLIEIIEIIEGNTIITLEKANNFMKSLNLGYLTLDSVEFGFNQTPTQIESMVNRKQRIHDNANNNKR